MNKQTGKWGERGQDGRLVLVGLAPALAERTVVAAGGPEQAAALATDALSRLHSLIANGVNMAVSRAGADGRLIEVWLPGWVVGQMDSAIGSQSGLGDRSAVMSAALEAHLLALTGRTDDDSDQGGKLTGPGAGVGDVPAPTFWQDELTAASASVRRAEALSNAASAGRSIARLEGLLNTRADGPLMKAHEVFPPKEMQVGALDPALVLVGSRVSVGSDAFVEPASGDWNQFAAGLSGLTNRVAPTLWAASRLLEMQIDAGGIPIPLGEFLVGVMGDAWRIGEGLTAWEGEHESSGFAVAARWPKLPRARRAASRLRDADPEAEHRRRLAQATTSFIEYSLITATVNLSGKVRERGPMAVLGLAAARLDSQGRPVVGVYSSAQRLLMKLGALGASCSYPHSDEAWRAYVAHLRDFAPPIEYSGMLRMLRLMDASTSRVNFYERVAEFQMQDPLTKRRKGSASKGHPTDANGFIGRLREWGLLVFEPGVFGPEALTERGRAFLAGLDEGAAILG